MGTWAINQLAAYPNSEIWQSGCIIVGDYFYSFGGYRGQYIYAHTQTTECFRYNIPLGLWEPLPSLSRATRPKLVYHEPTNKIIMFCDAGSSTALFMHVFNVTTQTFEPEVQVECSNGYINGLCGIHLYNNEIYIKSIGRISKYDGNSIVMIDDWSSTPATHGNASNDSPMEGFLNYIYWVSASDPYQGMVYKYNISTRIIEQVPASGGPTNVSMGVHWRIGTKFYIFSGNNSAAINYFDINSTTWHPGNPSSYAQRVGAGVAVDRGSMYILGGGYDADYHITNQFVKYSYFLDKPSNLTAEYSPTEGIILNWVDNSSEETNYVIFRKRDDESIYTELAVLPPNTYRFNDPNIDIDNHSYSYNLRARLVII